jgi:hypothetical protein
MAIDPKNAGAVSTVTMRRLNVNLPESVYDELRQLAQQSGRNITDLIRVALGLVKVAIEETVLRKHRIYIGTEDGTILKELVLPR